MVEEIRESSRRLVRELGFLRRTLAGTDLSPSAVHAIVEVGNRGSLTAAELGAILALEKSTVSRMLRKLIEGGQLKESPSNVDGRAKRLALTRRGERTFHSINQYARTQVAAALEKLPVEDQQVVLRGLTRYAAALESSASGAAAAHPEVTIAKGYRPGVIGRTAEMHARYYSRTVGFGQVFESKVATGIAEFTGRLDRPLNGLWTAVRDGAIVGTVAIDGEDMAPHAHLRWFIVDDGLRGGGIGRRLLTAALTFCDRHAFAETHLWTFRGLDAARRLYEAHGFVLADEFPGDQWGAEVQEQRFVRRVQGLPD